MTFTLCYISFRGAPPSFPYGFHQNLSDWVEIDTNGYISEVVLIFFKNLTFFFSIKTIHKGSRQNRYPDFQNPINPNGKVRYENA
jgi:hypothetical protein